MLKDVIRDVTTSDVSSRLINFPQTIAGVGAPRHSLTWPGRTRGILGSLEDAGSFDAVPVIHLIPNVLQTRHKTGLLGIRNVTSLDTERRNCDLNVK